MKMLRFIKKKPKLGMTNIFRGENFKRRISVAFEFLLQAIFGEANIQVDESIQNH